MHAMSRTMTGTLDPSGASAATQRLAEERPAMRRLRETDLTPDAETETGEPEEATIIEINSDADE